MDFDVIDDNCGLINKVYDRKNILIRPYVANIDILAIIVSSVPEIDYILVDKLLINCSIAGIKPIIIYNKNDLKDDKSYKDLISNYGSFIDIYSVSAKDNNVSELNKIFEHQLIAFAGQSAVGKSSLIQRLCGIDDIIIGDLSRIERGKNATRCIEIYSNNNYKIIDTCGFSSFFINTDPDKLYLCYDDFLKFQDDCKYHCCTHINEPECAVKDAVSKNIIPLERYQRYVLIYNEIKKIRRTYDK